jgi:hypothetical protein
MEGELKTITISDKYYDGGKKNSTPEHVVQSTPVAVPPSSASQSVQVHQHQPVQVSAVTPGTVQSPLSANENEKKDGLQHIDLDDDTTDSEISSDSSSESDDDSESIKSSSTIQTDELIQFSPQYHILKEFLKKKDSDENITDVLYSIDKNLNSISVAMSELNSTVASLTKTIRRKHEQ